MFKILFHQREKKNQGTKLLQVSGPQQNTENDKLWNNYNFYLPKI